MKIDKTFMVNMRTIVIPVALQNLINVAVTGADVMMLGRVSEKILSGASLANQIQFIMTLIFFGITSGATVLTAQYYGKGDMDAVRKIYALCMRMAVVVAIAFTVFALFFPQWGMRIYTSDPEVISYGVQYLRIVGFSYLFSAVSMVYLYILRSLEQVIVSAVIYLISLIINVTINAILIFGMFGAPRLLIQGAAIGTLVARIMEVVLCLIHSRQRGKLPINIATLKEKNTVLKKDYLHVAMPVLLNELLWGLGISMTAAIIGHIGAEAVAANSIIQVLRQLAMVMGMGFASGAAITLGKFLGRQQMDHAEQYAAMYLKASIIAGFVGATIVFLAIPIIKPFLTLSPMALNYLDYMGKIMFFYILAQSLNCTLIVGVFRAGGMTRLGLYLEIGALWGVSVLTGWLFAFVFAAPFKIVYTVILTDEFLKAPIAYMIYKKKNWLNHLTRENIEENAKI